MERFFSGRQKIWIEDKKLKKIIKITIIWQKK